MGFLLAGNFSADSPEEAEIISGFGYLVIRRRFLMNVGDWRISETIPESDVVYKHSTDALAAAFSLSGFYIADEAAGRLQLCWYCM